MNKKIKFFLKLIVTSFFLLILFQQIDLKEALILFQQGDFYYILFAGLFFLIAVIMGQGLRLYILLGENVNGVFQAVALLLKGMFFNSLLPTSFGGDGYKVLELSQKNNRGFKYYLLLIGLERAIGFIVLITGSLIYYIFNKKIILERINELEFFANDFFINRNLILLVIIIVAILLFFIINHSKKKIIKLMVKAKEVLVTISLKKYILMFVFSIIYYLMKMIGVYYLILYFNSSISFFSLIFILAVVAVITMLPISIGGLGVKESVLAFGLVMFGVARTNAVAVSIMNRLIIIIFSMIGGSLFWLDNSIFRRNESNGSKK